MIHIALSPPLHGMIRQPARIVTKNTIDCGIQAGVWLNFYIGVVPGRWIERRVWAAGLLLQ